MEIREVYYKRKEKKDIFINFILSSIIVLIFFIYSEYINILFTIPSLLICIITLLILSIIYFFIFNKKSIYKNNLIEVFSAFYFTAFYFFIIYISKVSYSDFFLIITLLFLKSMFFENDNMSIYIYIILYEFIAIILLHNPSLWYIFLSINIFFILINLFINRFKNISSDLEDSIYNINSENISYKNQHQSNSNFINQILFELDDYLKNLTFRNEYKKNIVIIRSVQKKLKERVSIINKDTSLKIEVFSIDKIISEILDSYSAIIIGKNINVYFNKFTKIDYAINTDKDKIKEILSEIIENAINFSYENSSIIITEDKIYDKISIRIKNYSENNINTDKIYKLNYSNGKDSSVGLGLYIAKKYSQLTQTRMNIYKNTMTEDIISDIDIKIII